MARRITGHSTRLSQVHEAAVSTEFAVGQRVQTIDGMPGLILFVSSAFSPGVTEYEVKLDHGIGEGTYTASQLRPVPADYRGGSPPIPAGLLPAGVTAAIEAEAGEVHLASLSPGLVVEDRTDLLMTDPELLRQASLLTPRSGVASADLQHLGGSQLEPGSALPALPRGHGSSALGVSVSHVIGVGPVEEAPHEVDTVTHIASMQDIKRSGVANESFVSPAMRLDHPGSARLGVGPVPEVPVSQPRSGSRPQPADHRIESGGEFGQRNAQVNDFYSGDGYLLPEPILGGMARSATSDIEVFAHSAIMADPELDDSLDTRLASYWYPEMGSVLHDRPDPGALIRVVGLRKTAEYAPLDDSWDDQEVQMPWHDSDAMDPPGREIHRGMALQLPEDVHRVVHDESRPDHERGFALARHLLTNPHPSPVHGQGLGYNWTDNPGIAKYHAERAGGIGENETPVVLHGRLPDREHMEDDPNLLRERHRARAPELNSWHDQHDPWSFPSSDEREVSMKAGGSVPITGVSWGSPGRWYANGPQEHEWHGATWGDVRNDNGYRHLDFPEGLSAKASATYGRPDDARDGEYNGGGQDAGMYWAEPANQDWVEKNLGPQEEAPPPPWGDSDVPPVLARLAQIEEARQFFGTPRQETVPASWRVPRHATTINGTQIDEHGDAPGHGSVPRASEPNSYDARSTEGDGDPKWSAAPPEEKRRNNGATVGMYPEGMSAGDGPGLPIGAFVAIRIGADTGPMSVQGLEDHLMGAHGYTHRDIEEAAAGADRGDWADHRDALYNSHLVDHSQENFANWETHPHGQLAYHPVIRSRREDGGPLTPQPSPGNVMDANSRRARWEEHYPREETLSPREDPVPDGGAIYRGRPEGEDIDPVFGSRHVPWTGQERTELHGWEAAPAAGWGDFVNRQHFTNKTPPDESAPGAVEELQAQAAWDSPSSYGSPEESRHREFDSADWRTAPGGKPEHAGEMNDTEDYDHREWTSDADPNDHRYDLRGRFDHTLSNLDDAYGPDEEDRRYKQFEPPGKWKSGQQDHSGDSGLEDMQHDWDREPWYNVASPELHAHGDPHWIWHTLSSLGASGEDDDAWRWHMENHHGWTQGHIDDAAARGNRIDDLHAALHDAGQGGHQHTRPVPEAYQIYQHHLRLNNMFGRDVRTYPEDRQDRFARPERGGAAYDDPMSAIIRSRPARPPAHPDLLQDSPDVRDRATFRRMMSALEAREALIRQLEDDYPPDSLEWIRHAKVSGPHMVPLTDIDWNDRHTWTAYKQPVKCGDFLDTLRKKAAKGKTLKPSLIVAAPGKKPFIGDGHHRSIVQLLAAVAGDVPAGVWAFMAEVDQDRGPWDEMHDRQIRASSKDSTRTDTGPDAPPEEVSDFQDQVDGAVAAVGAGDDHDSEDNSLDSGSPEDNPRTWPMAGTSVTERGRAYTQGRDDGKKRRNMVAPGAGSAGPPDAGSEQKRGIPARPGTSKKAHLDAFVAAAGDPEFRFHFTAAWSDVVAKAQRIRREGKVRITHASAGMVIGAVSGDHDVYETGIQRPPHKPQTIQHWACGCPWASFHQDRSLGTRYAGRPCSHVMALQFEAQARTMFGREMHSDPGVPSQELVVKSLPPWTPSGWAQTWLAPSASLHTASSGVGCYYEHEGPCHLGGMDRTAESLHHPRPAEFYSEIRPNPEHDPAAPWHSNNRATHVLNGYLGPKLAGQLHFAQSDDGVAAKVENLHTGKHAQGRGIAAAMMDDLYHEMNRRGGWISHGIRTDDGNNWWAAYREPYPEVNAAHTHPDTGWKHYWAPGDVAGDAEFNFEGAGRRGAYTPPAYDPHAYPYDERDEMWQHARGLSSPSQQATAALLAAGEDPAEVDALRLLAGLRTTADQANAPWGSDNVSQHPTGKPYGATEKPNKDMSPASYGFLSAPDPANWGGIQDNSAIQAPLTNEAHLLPPHLAYPDIPDQDSQGSFGYSDRSNTAGPATPMDPGDPQGLSVDAELHDEPEPALPSTTGDDIEATAANTNTAFIAKVASMLDLYHHTTPENAQSILQSGYFDANGDRDDGDPDDFDARAYFSDQPRGVAHRRYGPATVHFRIPEHAVDWEDQPEEGENWYSVPAHQIRPQHIVGIEHTAATASLLDDEPYDLELYHHTDPESANKIGESGRFVSEIPPEDERDGEPHAYFSSRKSGIAAEDYGTGSTVHVRVPSGHAKIDDFTPDGEIFYKVPTRLLGRENILGVEHAQGRQAAADGTIGGEDAGTGDGTPDAASVAGLGEWGASIRRMLAGTPMGDLGRETSPQAQQPSVVTQQPGMGSMDEPMMPDDQSIQTIGGQQWSGGGADSDEVAVEPGQPQGSLDDIVAQFQRSAAAKQFAGGGPGAGAVADGDIAAAARQYLSKTADVLPDKEAAELINEGRGERARNLGLLRLEGTHYEELGDEQGDQVEDDLVWA